MIQPAGIAETYRDKGYAAPIRVLDVDEAERYRLRLEKAIARPPERTPPIRGRL